MLEQARGRGGHPVQVSTIGLALLVFVGAAALAGLRGIEAPESPDAVPPWARSEDYRPRNLSLERIRRHGAIGNLNEGIEIKTQGVSARLLAWPGIGFQNQSLHVLTLKPAERSRMYTYALAEEALVCIFGQGEVFLRDQWVTIAAGDIAYFPEGVAHAVRNPRGKAKELVLIAQITPPQLDLYTADGFYDQKKAVFNYDAIFAAERKAKPGQLPQALGAQSRESHPNLRAWNLTNEDIRRKGALFNLFRGAEFTGIRVPMRLVLFPGYGTRFAGPHSGILPAQQDTKLHTHPISEDIIVTLAGRGWSYIDGKRVENQRFDAAMATVLARHGGGGSRVAADPPAFVIGFARPPQLDLYLNTPYYKDGLYVRPEFKKLELTKANGK